MIPSIQGQNKYVHSKLLNLTFWLEDYVQEKVKSLETLEYVTNEKCVLHHQNFWLVVDILIGNKFIFMFSMHIIA